MSSTAPFVLLAVLCQYAHGSNFSTSEFDWPDTTDYWFDTTDGDGCTDGGSAALNPTLCQMHGSGTTSVSGAWTCGQYLRWYFGVEDGSEVDIVFTNCDSDDDMNFTMHLYTAPYDATDFDSLSDYNGTWTKISNQSLNNCDDGEDCTYEGYCLDADKETMAFDELPEAWYMLEMYSTCDEDCGDYVVKQYCPSDHDTDDSHDSHDSHDHDHDHDHAHTTAEGDDANALSMVMGMMIALIYTVV